ncbi:uncharacterized protein METZ01_LOCUS13130 [marine metagenome]|uniref:Uncharacterized protein n=1 Tax=marine metagenome TaxID=408172 RepID=A0A381P039_9ZZZZ
MGHSIEVGDLLRATLEQTEEKPLPLLRQQFELPLHAFKHHQIGLTDHSLHGLVEIQSGIHQRGPTARVY